MPFVDVEVNEVRALTTLLDPRYKTSGFMDKAKAEVAKEKLVIFYPISLKGLQLKIVFKVTQIPM